MQTVMLSSFGSSKTFHALWFGQLTVSQQQQLHAAQVKSSRVFSKTLNGKARAYQNCKLSASTCYIQNLPELFVLSLCGGGDVSTRF